MAEYFYGNIKIGGNQDSLEAVREVEKNIKDKSGTVHTPFSRAKDLARQSFKKVKNEMLGIAPGNQ